MPDFVPIDYDPFGADQANNVQLTPVDHDPFAGKSKYYLATHGIETAAPAETQPKPFNEVLSEAKTAREAAYRATISTIANDKLFGLNGQERYQLFPERLAKDIYEGIQQNPIDPATGRFTENAIETGFNIAGLAGGAPVAIKPGVATLGSGLIRPVVNMNKNEVAPVFYSAVEHAVNNVSQPKMTGQQWLGTLANKPGVKPEEMGWTGLDNFLKENANKPITKQEVQDFVNGNKVQLQEVTKGESNYYHPIYKDTPARSLETFKPILDQINTVKDIAAAKAYNINFRETVKGLSDQQILDAVKEAKTLPSFDEIMKHYDTRAEAEAAIKNAGAENHLDIKTNEVLKDTKYQSYQLPGGENYRETLLTLPDPNKIRAKLDPINKRMNEISELPAREHTPELTQEWDNLNVQRKTLMYDEAGNIRNEVHSYTSSHWDEPNVLAHVRMNDRVINGDKSLHIEEIQSDWHQAGRNKGYNTNKATKAYNDYVTDLKKRVTEDITNEAKKNNVNDAATNSLIDIVNNKTSARDLAKYVGEDDKWLQMSNATYRETSGVPDAPFKKTWHELVLKRMIREAAEKGYDKLSWTPGEAQAARYDLSKQVDSVHYNPETHKLVALKNDNAIINENSVKPVDLEKYVGKEVAKKLMDQEPNVNGLISLKEEGLKVGGEGMKGFYDQIIPKALEKITGEKVKTANISGEYGIYDKGGNLLHKFKSSNEAKIWNDMNPVVGGGRTIKQLDQKVHYIDIPQKLKDTAMQKGFPLFSGGFMLSPVEHDPFEDNKK